MTSTSWTLRTQMCRCPRNGGNFIQRAAAAAKSIDKRPAQIGRARISIVPHLISMRRRARSRPTDIGRAWDTSCARSASGYWVRRSSATPPAARRSIWSARPMPSPHRCRRPRIRSAAMDSDSRCRTSPTHDGGHRGRPGISVAAARPDTQGIHAHASSGQSAGILSCCTGRMRHGGPMIHGCRCGTIRRLVVAQLVYRPRTNRARAGCKEFTSGDETATIWPRMTLWRGA